MIKRAAYALTAYLTCSFLLPQVEGQLPSGQPTTQPTSTLHNDLVAYYPFNSNANDASGHGNNGVVHSATLATDRFGEVNSAYSFDGATSYVEIVNGSPFSFVNNFSLSLWIKPAGTQGSNPILIGKSLGYHGGYCNGWFLGQPYTNILNQVEFGYFCPP